MNKLQLVQNSAAKIILGGKKYDHVTDHLVKLHWLPISQRGTFKSLLLVFKALNGQGPIYLTEMLVPCSSCEHNLRSSYDNLLVVPATESVSYGYRAFSVLGPTLWNNLPKKIRCSSVPSFKTALKTHLFKQSFFFFFFFFKTMSLFYRMLHTDFSNRTQHTVTPHTHTHTYTHTHNTFTMQYIKCT